MNIVRKSLCAAAAGALGFCSTPTPAQELSIRIAVSPHTMPPLHSYISGEHDGWAIFFTGISGMGLHSLLGGADPGLLPPSFPVKVFNRDIIALHLETGEVRIGGTAHLPASVRLALTVTNAPGVQIGSTLHLYGGYGPNADESDWETRATVTSIDLPAVLAALTTADPIPAGAFVIESAPEAQVAGAAVVKFDERRFVLIGGSNFIGDYAGNTSFANIYAEKAQIFDADVSLAVPLRTLESATLHRRDMNALPMTYTDTERGRTPGFAIAGGVFQNGFFVWQNPLYFKAGDPAVTDVFAFQQQMNQYEGGALSFYSEQLNENRQVLFGGISNARHENGVFIPDFQVPWVSDITQIRVRDGEYLDEIVIGQTPLPTTNLHTLIDERVPRSSNGQILLDELPPAEIPIARLPAGLRAAEPAGAPITFPSGEVWEVHATYGKPGDINRDGAVNGVDLLILLSAYGSVTTRADLNWNGAVDSGDLLFLLSNWD